MSTINKAILIGNLGNDPEYNESENGKQLCTFRIATSEKYNDKEYTEWHQIEVWGAQAAACSKYLSKGKAVYVEGKIRTSTWVDKNKQEQKRTFISAHTVKFISPARKEQEGVQRLSA